MTKRVVTWVGGSPDPHRASQQITHNRSREAARGKRQTKASTQGPRFWQDNMRGVGAAHAREVSDSLEIESAQ